MTLALVVIVNAAALIWLVRRVTALRGEVATLQDQVGGVRARVADHGSALQDVRAESVSHGDALAMLTRKANAIGEVAASAQATATSHEAAVRRWEADLARRQVGAEIAKATVPKAKRRRS